MKKLVSMVLALSLLLSVAAVAPAFAEGEYVKLTWAQGTGETAPIDNDMVLESLNEISRAKLNCEVDIKYFTGDQIATSIASGEVYDMYFTCSWYNNFNQGVSSGLFANITDKVKEWTPDLYATMPEKVWELAKSSDGNLYAIPVKKDYCPENFIIYDKGFYDELGMTWPTEISDFNEVTPFLEAYKAAKPDEYPIMVGGSVGGIDTIFDYIDRDINIGVSWALNGQEGGTTVKSVYEEEVVVNRWKCLYEWMQAGYINPDAATGTESSIDTKHNHLKFVQCWDGYDYSPSYEYTCGMTRISGPFLSTDGVQGSMNAFSITLEDDLERFELALKYQELVNTDLLYRDTLRYGVPGYHFNYVTEEQSAAAAGAVIRTQAGSDNYNPWAFSQGSYALASIATSQDAIDGKAPMPIMDQWDQYFAVCETAPVSDIAGFTFDSSNWTAQIAEIKVIKEKYWKMLTTGTIDPETNIPLALEEYRAAGLDEIIADCQAQVDAYIAGK